MKSNERLQQDVVDELAWDPQVDGSGIGVQVKDGIVSLSGHVGSYAEKLAAEKAARRVSGVKALTEDLEVRPSAQYKLDDATIAQAVLNALRWNMTVPFDKVQVTVDRGWIKLQGQVNWFFQREAAERSVRYLSGV